MLLKNTYGLQSLSGTYSNSGADSSQASGYGCQQCLRHGWVYAVPDTQTWYTSLVSGENYSGMCCETFDADCGSAYDSSQTNNLATGWKASHLIFTSVDMAIAACPQKEDVCIKPDITKSDAYCS